MSIENIKEAIVEEEEVLEFQEMIDNKPDGEYELKDIIGTSNWPTVFRPRALGQKFKKLVDSGNLMDIKFKRKKSDKHLIYEIKHSAEEI